MDISKQFDVVMVGAGIAGLAMAAVLGQRGMKVAVLEKCNYADDPLRGDWISPWGVAELKTLGLYESIAMHSQTITHHVIYSPFAQQRRIELDNMVVGVKGALGIRYTELRQVLVENVKQNTAFIYYGVKDILIENESRIAIKCKIDGVGYQFNTMLIVGADGRNSIVRRRMKIALHSDPLHHFYFGLLFDQVKGMNSKQQFVASEGGVSIFAHPVGRKVLRTYMCVDPVRFKSFQEKGFLKSYLSALNMKSVEGVGNIVNAKILGKCSALPNSSTWVDVPYKKGVILIGDAAGSDDPITGQGLSNVFRDVRIISELISNSEDWCDMDYFKHYYEERKERMRRLRFTSSIIAARDAEFDELSERRRKRMSKTIDEDPSAGLALWSQYMGPEKLPKFAFSDDAKALLMSTGY